MEQQERTLKILATDGLGFRGDEANLFGMAVLGAIALVCAQRVWVRNLMILGWDRMVLG